MFAVFGPKLFIVHRSSYKRTRIITCKLCLQAPKYVFV